jgi:hypothetical protein
MAETLAACGAVGAASGLITFCDVAWRVVKHINEYSNKAGDMPAVITRIKSQLPLLAEKMTELKDSLKTGVAQCHPKARLWKLCSAMYGLSNIFSESRTL